MNKKKIIVDMALNVIASAIPTVVLQLIILPLLANKMIDERYGLLVTVLALLNVLPSTIGNVLNNIRLLYNEKYEEKQIAGDFNLLLALSAIVNIIVFSAFTIFYDKEHTVMSLLLNVIVSCIWMSREYFIVAFRLKIDYIAIIINNTLQAGGFLLGYYLFLKTNSWQIIYFSGYILSLAHIICKSQLWREPICKTSLFKTVSFQSFLLFLSNLLTRIITYADKLLIYPILGGSVVSVFYTATVFGKVISLIITPITSVALSYLAKVKTKSDSAFNYSLGIGTVVCFIGYIVCIAISEPVLSFLYPQYVDKAMTYIFVTTGTTVIQTLISIVNPFILKFFDMRWQIFINSIAALLYILLCMFLLSLWGLMGFCIGALLTNTIKLFFMVGIYYKSSLISMESSE